MPDYGRTKLLIEVANNVELRVQRNRTANSFQLHLRSGWLGRRRMVQSPNQFAYEALIIRWAFPDSVLKWIENAGKWLGKRSGVIHADRQQSWLAMLPLGSFMGNFNLIRQ